MDPIFVWWIGEEEADRELMGHVRLHLARAFDRPATLWTGAARPRHAFDPRRKQHASGVILRWLLETGPSGGKVLGVTDRDLFIPILTYVFGEAQLGGRAALVSLARLAEDVELLGPQLLVERLAKEAVHEVGHAFGLVHCDVDGCVMGRSPAVREVDLKGAALCGECRAKYRQLSGGRS
jgi:archaemetzincin